MRFAIAKISYQHVISCLRRIEIVNILSISKIVCVLYLYSSVPLYGTNEVFPLIEDCESSLSWVVLFAVLQSEEKKTQVKYKYFICFVRICVHYTM